MSAETEVKIGRAAYEAYCEERGWKAFDGKPLPQWDDVALGIKQAWITAAKAAVQKFFEESI